MPVPERETRSEPRSSDTPSRVPSSVSMKDLLASCAAASAVSTPPDTAAPEDDEQAREEQHHAA